MKPWAVSFYTSMAWRNCREAYAKSVGGLCERCLRRGMYVPGVIVHHKVHLTPENISDPTISCAFGNLELLCRDCHGEEHQHVRRRYRVDEAGRVVASPPVENS